MKRYHGSAWSYIVGFLFSAELTILAYELVVHHSLAPNKLLLAVLGLAVTQMLLQIFFFLHLGRGPKPLYNIAFFLSTVVIILVVVGGSLLIINNLHYNMPPSNQAKQLAEDEGIAQVEGNKTGACPEIGNNHPIIISSGSFSPSSTEASLCDTLSFTAGDTGYVLIFGTEAAPTNYAGNDELDIRKGKNVLITLNQAGTYKFYDQQHPETTGEFTVSQ